MKDLTSLRAAELAELESLRRLEVAGREVVAKAEAYVRELEAKLTASQARAGELEAIGRRLIRTFDEAKALAQSGVMAPLYPKSERQLRDEGNAAINDLRAALTGGGLASGDLARSAAERDYPAFVPQDGNEP